MYFKFYQTNYRLLFCSNNSRLSSTRWAIVIREFAERQSGYSINGDAERRAMSISYVTMFGIRHPVAVKPLDTRPDTRGKAQHVHQCRVQARQAPSRSSLGYARVCACDATWHGTSRHPAATTNADCPKVERLTWGRKPRLRMLSLTRKAVRDIIWH